MSADVLVGQLVYLHVEVSCFLILEPNVQEGLLQLLLDRSQGKAKIFIARTASQNKDLEHAQSEVVVILASGRHLICILAKVSCQLFKVFSRILTWEPCLDDCFEVFKPFNRGRLDGLEELEPHHWKESESSSFSVTLLLSSVESEASKLGPGCHVVGPVILVVMLSLGFCQQLCRLDRVPGVSLDNISHLGVVGWVHELSNGVHPGVLEMIPDNILEADRIITWLEGDLVPSSPKVVPFLGCRNVDRVELVGRGVL